MADKLCKQGEENTRKQLAAAVRSIQWSYAIFWSPSSKESGVLQWGDGYYNGDIKTRRTVLSMDSKADDETGSRRSDQLRELYDSLLSGNNNIKNSQTRRPLAALSPEDLTNVEWFYLICMSFVFNIGQGLPGRSLASGRTIWLSNAHRVDTGVFSRSLLAKSAGIKTVVCFPLIGGVVELGATELVEEDLNVIQLVRTAFLENSSSPPDVAAVALSPSGSSNGAELIQPPLSDVLLFQAQSWRGGVIMEDDQLSNCVLTPTMNSSDCVSQSVVVHYSECALITPSKIEREPYDINCDDPPISDDLHYQNVLSSIFKESNDQRVLGSSSGDNLHKKSSFRSWIEGGMETEKPEFCVVVTPQKMLKKMLFEVPQMMMMHSAAAQSVDQSKDELCKQQEIIPNTNHVLAERRRREKVNERFSTLRSLIPSITKADKISILDDTITYLKELEKRVVELESCQESSARETKKKRKEIDIEERTSDNYDDEISVGGVKNKRKTREVEDQEEGQECGKLSSRDSLVVDNTITVSMAEEEILIDISCRWRESLLLQIIDAMSNLHLDSQSVHSSTVNGVLSLKVQSKVKGSISVSVGMITQSLQRVLRNS